mmetsp:Transcript_32170/g.102522  ORF Transcript_32170/g.102522 Transcript_32170/m.102522 type:complete len:527 (-) Transcript_32170:55-1635(-)
MGQGGPIFGLTALTAFNTALATAYFALGFVWTLAAARRRRSTAALPGMLTTAQGALHSPPALAVVLPVKGAHPQSASNWRAQLTQHGYSGHVTFVFVVQELSDPAYVLIKQLQAQGSLPIKGVKVLVAGLARNTSQKLHNMIYAIERVDETAELVLMLDDDMRMAPGAVDLLAHDLLSDPSLLAASGFSYDVPARWSPVTHAACIFRLLLEVSVSTGGASAAWGGCCMMRRAHLLGSVPDGVMQHWKDDGYSDDWIITQVARRHNRRISNPPLLFLNLVEFSTFKQVYNFLHRQFFVLDTYVRPPPGESSLPWVDPHRRESYLLALAMAAGGLLFALAPPMFFSQLASLYTTQWAANESWPVRLARPEVLTFLACFGLAAPFALSGGRALVRAQAGLISTLSPAGGERMRQEGAWSNLLAPIGFHLYTAMCPFFVVHGILGSTVVWSGAQYHKLNGRVARIQRPRQSPLKSISPPLKKGDGSAPSAIEKTADVLSGLASSRASHPTKPWRRVRTGGLRPRSSLRPT